MPGDGRNIIRSTLKHVFAGSFYLNILSGERGIRTLGTVARTTVFETVPFNHSGISPKQVFTKKAANAALAEREGFEPPDL